jgi:tRNA threonylcarbamoyladenosine biosynthesis protein TsaE
MKKYDISKNQVILNFHTLVHLDLYRLGRPGEFGVLKPEQFLDDPHALVCVEWPERVGEALPKADISMQFSSDGVGKEERYIEVT